MTAEVYISEEGCRYGLGRNTSRLNEGCVRDGRRCVGVLDQSVSPSPLHRTVLSVSRSQSLGGGREKEDEEDEDEEKEAVAGCWSTASSGTKARLSPLKDTAGSIIL